MPSFLLAINNNNSAGTTILAGVPADVNPGIIADFALNDFDATLFDAASLLMSSGMVEIKAGFPAVAYRCVLTGSANGLSDLIIPISSFQIRKRTI